MLGPRRNVEMMVDVVHILDISKEILPSLNNRGDSAKDVLSDYRLLGSKVQVCKRNFQILKCYSVWRKAA